MIFYVLDAEWEETKDEQPGDFLSDANPFLFTDIGSADPAVYVEFCKLVPEKVNIENSYEVAVAYVNSLNNEIVKKAFTSIEIEEWLECVKEYLSQEHKGKQTH